MLIVEDNAALLRALGRHISSWGADVTEVGTLAAATTELSAPFDLIISDIRLPDGSGFDLLRQASQGRPKPLLVAISGKASAEEAFELAQIGVRAYLPKPLTLEALTEAVELVRLQPPELEGLIRDCVGRVPMRQLQEQLRDVMLKQALALSEGSRSGAARLLDVSRQAVQQILRGAKKAEAQSAAKQAGADTPAPLPVGLKQPSAE